MHKRCLDTQVLSPLKSHGAYKNKLELRATEIKALMRYVFRISTFNKDMNKLYQAESALFGDASKQSSPITLQITNKQENIIQQKPLLHANKQNCKEVGMFGTDTRFTLILRGKASMDNEKFEEYINLLRYASFIGGIGQRSRRARGSISFSDYLCQDQEELIHFLYSMLTKLSPNTFQRIDNSILIDSCKKNQALYPIIEKIEIDEALTIPILQFFKNVDEASHKSRTCDKASDGSRTSKQTEKIFATGNAIGKRFASSLIIQLVKTQENKIYPVYVFLKPFSNKNKTFIDNREEFIKLLKGANV